MQSSIPKNCSELTYDAPRDIALEIPTEASPAYNIFSTMPEEVKGMIVQKMDIMSCINFRATCVDNYILVKNHAKFNIEINVDYVAEGQMEIKIKKENENKEALVVDVKKVGGRQFTVSTIDTSNNQLLRCRSFKKSSMSIACFRTLGRIIKDKMFKTQLLHFQLGSFTGNLDLGLKFHEIGILSFKNCFDKRTVRSMFMNFNCSYEHLEFDFPSMCQKRMDVRELMQESVNYYWNYIFAINDAYSVAFPPGYIIDSESDAIQNTNIFFNWACILGLPIYRFDGVSVKKRSEQAYLGLMYIRAAYGEVSSAEFLQKNDEQNYEKTIEQLRHGIKNYKLGDEAIAILSSIFIQTCIWKGNVHKIPKVMYAALHCEFDQRCANHEKNAFEKFLGRIEYLTRVDWNARRW